MGRMMYRVSASRARFIFAFTLTPMTAFIATPSSAQVAARDTSDRVYRIQLRQRGDTSYVRTLRITRRQLEARLDSLRREFEVLSLESPDRLAIRDELTALLSSVGNLTDLERSARAKLAEGNALLMRERVRALVGGDAFAGPFVRADALLLPGWIGINVEAPHQRIVRGDSSYIRYFSYPEIVSVEPNSPAERVGISRGDHLLAYDGNDVRDREINLTKLLQPDRRVVVRVRRDGDEREFPVVVAKAPPRLMERRMLSVPDEPAAGLERMIVVPRNGLVRRAPAPRIMILGDMDAGSMPIAGANLSEIHDEAFGHIFGVTTGVLVTEVFSDPARGSGLRGGDVIQRADGQDVTRIAQLRRIVAAHDSDRSVELQIVRQKKARTLTLRW
jgi:hypothetical protein